jgi:N-acetylglucosaminyl-diphospho-decaprenol L-rhamnosyltransferase
MTTADHESASRLAIVVVTYGAHHLLEENLARIDLAADTDVILVDNWHSQAERDAIDAIARTHEWQMLPMPRNVGFGAAANVGVAEARRRGATVVLLLNPDATLGPDAIAAMLAVCAADPRAVVSPRIVRTDGSTWFRGGVIDLRRGRIAHGVPAPGSDEQAWLTAACLMLSIDMFDAAGGFDPDFFLYLEDVDLTRRCADAGARLVVREDLVAVHAVGGTQQPSGKSPMYFRFNCRNRLVFAAKHLSRLAIARWLVRTPAASWSILMRGGRRQVLTTPAAPWAALRGTLAGVGVALRALMGFRPARHATVEGRPADKVGVA